MPGWSEKYRPRKFEEFMDQDHVVGPVKKLIESVRRGERDLPHMLFVGPAGTGKTTLAYIIARELGWDIVELNASDERGIDTIRGKVKYLAYSAGRRIILLDEADSLTEDAQHALRRIMEQARGSRFILTANYDWRIIDPIKSRCAIFYFNPLPREMVVKRLVEILRGEGVKITKQQLPVVKEALGIIVDLSGGDMRKAINLLEEIVSSRVELTPEAVKGYATPAGIGDAISKALEGDLEAAVRAVEDQLVQSRLDIEKTINVIYSMINKISDPYVKSKALYDLARLEQSLRTGGSPLIQLAGYIAGIWYYSMTSPRRRMSSEE